MEPTTLQEAIVFFDKPKNCREYLVARRWPNGVVCPRCGGTSVTFLAKYNRWQCGARHSNRQFTSKTGTIFEDSPLPLGKWLTAMWQIVNCKSGISSYEVHRAIGITQKSAWFMDHRIRFALGMEEEGKASGHIEADETFIGGKARNMHKDKRERMRQPDNLGKTVVAAVLERGGKVRTKVVSNRKKKTVQANVRENVEAGWAVYADEFLSYDGLDEYTHKVINHAVAYVRANVYTNGMENFWSLLKRGRNGTYISVEPFHLFRYLDEQAFRYNNRKDDSGEPITDGQRFDLAVRQIVGKRLTWDRLTGKLKPSGRMGVRARVRGAVERHSREGDTMDGFACLMKPNP